MFYIVEILHAISQNNTKIDNKYFKNRKYRIFLLYKIWRKVNMGIKVLLVSISRFNLLPLSNKGIYIN